MRIDDFMLLLYIKRLKVVRGTHCLHGIVTSMLSLVNCVDTFGVMINDMLINHLSSPRSAHIRLIIFDAIISGFFCRGVKCISKSLLSIVIVISVLNDLLVFHRTLTSSRIP